MTDTWTRVSDPEVVATSETAVAGADPATESSEQRVLDTVRYESALQTMERARCDSLREFLG